MYHFICGSALNVNTVMMAFISFGIFCGVIVFKNYLGNVLNILLYCSFAMHDEHFTVLQMHAVEHIFSSRSRHKVPAAFLKLFMALSSPKQLLAVWFEFPSCSVLFWPLGFHPFSHTDENFPGMCWPFKGRKHMILHLALSWSNIAWNKDHNPRGLIADSVENE